MPIGPSEAQHHRRAQPEQTPQTAAPPRPSARSWDTAVRSTTAAAPCRPPQSTASARQPQSARPLGLRRQAATYVTPQIATPCNNLGTSPVNPAACRMNPRRAAGMAFTNPNPRSLHPPQQRVVIRKQPVHPIHPQRQRRRIKPPPRLIPLQHVRRARYPRPAATPRPAPRPAPPHRASQGSAPAPPTDAPHAPHRPPKPPSH